jgi:hypothetical protein
MFAEIRYARLAFPGIKGGGWPHHQCSEYGFSVRAKRFSVRIALSRIVGSGIQEH